MTVPPEEFEPPRRPGGRHAAPSPTGSYLPPMDDDESVTAQMPRIDDQTFAEFGLAPRRSAAPDFGLSAYDLRQPAAPGAPPAAARPPAAGHSPAAAFPPVVSAPPATPVPPVASVPVASQHPPEPYPSSRRSASGPSSLRLVWIYPDLLSTYGDRGNLLMLARRASLRGLRVEPVELTSDQPVPRQGDIYLLGGGEDLPQVLAANRLRADGGLRAAAQDGAVIFAVCAGYQLIGSVFGGAQGEPVEGLSILDISSGRGERRGVGELAADVDPELGVDRLTGFENHQGVTTIGRSARPLARTLTGVGNGDGTEGAYSGKILGTYLHGPALVRNPGLADLLLAWATGMRLGPLPDAQEAWTRQLRAERLAAVS